MFPAKQWQFDQDFQYSHNLNVCSPFFNTFISAKGLPSLQKPRMTFRWGNNIFIWSKDFFTLTLFDSSMHHAPMPWPTKNESSLHRLTSKYMTTATPGKRAVQQNSYLKRVTTAPNVVWTRVALQLIIATETTMSLVNIKSSKETRRRVTEALSSLRAPPQHSSRWAPRHLKRPRAARRKQWI